MTIQSYIHLISRTLLLPLSVLVSGLTVESAYAQDGDPMVEITQFVQVGDEKAELASKKMRAKNLKTKRIDTFFDALKSFSSALRRLDEYQIEDLELIDQIGKKIDTIINDRDVSRALSNLRDKLMSALKNKNYSEATQMAQQLVDLDQRNDAIQYLLSVLMDLTPVE